MSERDDRPTGRVEPTEQQFAAIAGEEISFAPRAMVGVSLPAASPPLWQYRNDRARVQYTGTCVGQSGVGTVETSIITPANLLSLKSVSRNQSISLSPLALYWMGRRESKLRNVALPAEGAILSHTLAAARKRGFFRMDVWPDTEQNERSYRDWSESDLAAQGIKLYSPLHIQNGDWALIQNFDDILGYLAKGYTVWVGMDWPENWRDTNQDGILPKPSSRTIGGHAVEFAGYDGQWLAIGNSWRNWGAIRRTTKTNSGIGWCGIDDLRRHMTQMKFDGGRIEAAVVLEVSEDLTDAAVA